MKPHHETRTVLHLVHEAPDAWVLKLIEAQKADGLRVEVIRLDEEKDWGRVVDRVLGADSVCSW